METLSFNNWVHFIENTGWGYFGDAFDPVKRTYENSDMLTYYDLDF